MLQWRYWNRKTHRWTEWADFDGPVLTLRAYMLGELEYESVGATQIRVSSRSPR